MDKEIRVEARIKNNVLWHAMYDQWPTVAEFCRANDPDCSKVYRLLSLRMSPIYREKGGGLCYRAIALKLADALFMAPDELFPSNLYSLKQTEAVFEISFAALPDAREILRLPSGTTPEDEVAELELRAAVARAVNDLPPRLKTIVLERFVEGKYLHEIGAEFNLSRERIRELGEQGLAKIRAHIRTRDVR